MTYHYKRKAHYHETDQMGIIHHTNYIKWFEEARIAYLSEIGVPYDGMEAAGIISPVLHVGCDYKQMVRFADEVIVHTAIDFYNSVRFSVSYKVTDPEGKVVYVVGESKHCFLNDRMRPVALKKVAPEMDRILAKVVNQDPLDQ